MSKILVLECQSGVAKKSGNAYNIALIRDVQSKRVGKVFSDIPLVASDKEVDVEIELAPNSEMFLTPRIKKLVQGK